MENMTLNAAGYALRTEMISYMVAAGRADLVAALDDLETLRIFNDMCHVGANLDAGALYDDLRAR